jgi:DNA-directed RNA polymerase I and III subunit RPAC1
MYLPMGVDNSWDMNEFSDNFQIKINHMDASSMEFDIIGIDPAIANTLRRILIAEVPTVAIEHVFFVNNTSVIQVSTQRHKLGRSTQNQ